MCYYNETVKIKPIHTKVLNCDSSILAGLGLKTLHFIQGFLPHSFGTSWHIWDTYHF